MRTRNRFNKTGSDLCGTHGCSEPNSWAPCLYSLRVHLTHLKNLEVGVEFWSGAQGLTTQEELPSKGEVQKNNFKHFQVESPWYLLEKKNQKKPPNFPWQRIFFLAWSLKCGTLLRELFAYLVAVTTKRNTKAKWRAFTFAFQLWLLFVLLLIIFWSFKLTETVWQSLFSVPSGLFSIKETTHRKQNGVGGKDLFLCIFSLEAKTSCSLRATRVRRIQNRKLEISQMTFLAFLGNREFFKQAHGYGAPSVVLD